MSIFDAANAYAAEGTALIILAGAEYGSGSSRDWAAKGTLLLGVKAVLATSFERIHRSNLIGMGVLPLQFPPGSPSEPTTMVKYRNFRRRCGSIPPRRRDTSATAGYCNMCCDSSSSPERLAIPSGAATAGQNGSGGPCPLPVWRAPMRKQRLSNSPRTSAAVTPRWSEQCQAAHVHRMLAGLTQQQQ